jgi:hypothetical protein
MIADIILQLAMNTLGLEIEEDPPHANAGFWIEEFQRSTSNSIGDAWCMSWVHWIYEHAYSIVGKPTPLKRTAACYQQWIYAIANPDKFTVRYAGDMDKDTVLDHGGIWIRFDAQKKGHTGIVVSLRHGVLKYIAGNESDGVREGVKNIADIKDFKGIIMPKGDF